MCNRTQNDAIWGLIALFLTNQIAGNTIDFKMNVINAKTNIIASLECDNLLITYLQAFSGAKIRL